MTPIAKRRLGIILGVAVLAGALFGNKWLASQKQPTPRKPEVQSLKEVTTLDVENARLQTTLIVEGRLAAFDKVEIFSEVGGMLRATGKPFKVGTAFAKGNTLIDIDASEARLAIQAQKSTLMNSIAQMMPDLKIDHPESAPQWEAYLNAFNLDGALAELPSPRSDREKRFVASKNLYTQYYNIKSQEERLTKYRIVAPFSGVLTEASIQSGALVRTGQKLGTLMATGNYELVATVPLSQLSFLKVGQSVQLASEDIAGQWKGTVRRISDQIDPGSQTVQVFISVGGSNLREGMYLRGDVVGSSIDNAVRLPRNILVEQHNVYVLRDSILHLTPVDIVQTEPEHVIVRGLPNGTKVLSNLLPGLYDGIKVAP